MSQFYHRHRRHLSYDRNAASDPLRAKTVCSGNLLARGHRATSFTTTVGTVFEPRNYRRSFAAAVKRIGLPMIRVHDLRHTCATLLLSRGVHPKIVQELLGHSQISLTMDMYSHVLPTMQGEAVCVMERVLSIG